MNIRVRIKMATFSFGAVFVGMSADGPADIAVAIVFAVMVLIQVLNWIDATVGVQLRGDERG